MDKINYIKLHLDARGFDCKIIKFLHVAFSGTTYSHDIKAYNQLLFIDIAKLPANIQIIGDNNAMEIGERNDFKDTIEEFTGLISIATNNYRDNVGNWTRDYLQGELELIQVIRK